MDQIRTISNMMLFEKIKTGSSFKDAIVLAICMSIVSIISQKINFYMIDQFSFPSLERILHLFYKKNMITYEGKITCTTAIYDGNVVFSTVFTDSFKAIWEHILENISKDPLIHSIKEQTIYKKRYNDSDVTMYMVNQTDKFLVSQKHNIYAYTYMISDNNEQKDENTQRGANAKSKIEKIIIELFSYTSSIETIKQFVDDVTKKYISNIEDARFNKRFIYTMIKNTYDESPCEQWNETLFESTRCFDNLYFEGKKEVVEKIDYFLNHKDWYYNVGIPYSLGIGLCGPPGTGKTSFIKALAKYTNRHIISISLKLIKTKKQLDSVFFEKRYNEDNKKGSIGFDKKIIIFEDIDCIGDIVMDRDNKKEPTIVIAGSDKNMDAVNTAISKLTSVEDPPLTLDDILNLWDGIRETPSRIMIISSNHYNKLDPALTRPGRIDIKLELSYASRKIIGEIYKHMFNLELDKQILEEINDAFYSPAEIINIYMNCERNPQRFVERLIKNEH